MDSESSTDIILKNEAYTIIGICMEVHNCRISSMLISSCSDR